MWQFHKHIEICKSLSSRIENLSSARLMLTMFIQVENLLTDITLLVSYFPQYAIRYIERRSSNSTIFGTIFEAHLKQSV